ncbi:glycosyltransferase [Gracilibacillus alcaliphilus]|uniref:glycosyltransferase n=1 Tax=Gracilibacillus alcaliphilus TaxID=1401441 RepID=UPI001EF7D280|nr:glycosyltransferase [Gracilibacillus alcaliphilus]MBM7678407.1 glycosyltransferase involved in cell wall biosynthesis [Gracilibacillus alcaliphilus]
MKQRILLISTMYPSNKHPSFGIFIKNQVKRIEENGYEVELLVIKNPKTGKANLTWKYTTWLLKWLWLMVKSGRKYDVVHAHYVFPSGLLGLWTKRLFKIPLIVTAHGGDLEKMAKKNQRIHQYTQLILQEADHIITVGKRLEKQVASEYQVNPAKISLLNMGVNRSIFYPMSKNKLRETHQLPDDQPIILFVGNIIRNKGVKELITAFEQLDIKQAALYIIGAVKEPPFYQTLQNYIANHNIERVYFLPASDQATVAKWMNMADVLVVPSYIEGFGLVALEAMSCKTPVIGSNVGGLQYLLGDQAGIMVEPQNADALELAITEVLTNQALRQQMIANGEAKAESNDQEKLIQQLFTIYHGASRS